MVEMMNLDVERRVERKDLSKFGAIVPFPVAWALKSGIGERKWYMDPATRLVPLHNTPPACGGSHVLICYFKCLHTPFSCGGLHFLFLSFQIFCISRFHAWKVTGWNTERIGAVVEGTIGKLVHRRVEDHGQEWWLVQHGDPV